MKMLALLLMWGHGRPISTRNAWRMPMPMPSRAAAALGRWPATPLQGALDAMAEGEDI
jgi:hypothetical protein